MVPANRQHSSRQTMQDEAGIYGKDNAGPSGEVTLKLLPDNVLRETRRDIARRGESEVAGARTQGLRIKSPLLYRLSYNLDKKLPCSRTHLDGGPR
jgi:hypothetical protein